MDKKKDPHELLWDLIRKYNNNKTKAGKAVGMYRQKFNYYVSHSKEFTDTFTEKIEQALSKFEDKPYFLDERLDQLPRSERAKLVIADKEWRKKRSGRPPKKSSEIIRHRDDELNKKDRTDDQLAKKYHFTSRFTMRIAILVVEKGCLALIKKMNEKSISFKRAAKLALLPTVLQNDVLSKGEKGIADYFSPKESDETSITKLLHIAKKHAGFKKAQKETSLSLETILRDILVEGRLLLK